ncbi:MAG: methyltransferase domain-containing protein [Planctomycetes bacterium]|nr:methyltransferase domain-containing protein [Planctomycetota bacterium]
MKFVKVDGVEYEVLSPWRNFVKVMTNPWKNLLGHPWVLKKIMLWSGSPLARESMERPGGWRAMEIVYENAEPKNSIDAMACRYNPFPMALRNRKRYVTKRIAELINEYKEHTDKICVVGVGAGPGTNIQEGIVLSGIDKDAVTAYLVDVDSGAFEYGKEAAKKRGLDRQVHYVEGDAREIKKHLPINIQPHIVKMIGIVEYLSDEQVRELFTAMCEALAPGGAIITHGLVDYHNSLRFLRRVLNWHIHTRTGEDTMRLLKEAGFGEMDSFTTPMNIYTIITARK